MNCFIFGKFAGKWQFIYYRTIWKMNKMFRNKERNREKKKEITTKCKSFPL